MLNSHRSALALVLCSCIGLATFSPASAEPLTGLAAAKRQLQAGVESSQPDSILAARANFAALQEASPRDARLALWIAVASWRAVPLVQPHDLDRAKRICRDGIAAADRAIALDPKAALAPAIKASLQALSLSFSPGMAMSLSADMEESFGRAEGLNGKDPRVQLLKAIYTLHKPEFVGGGARKAMPGFDRSVALFRAERPDTSDSMDWGRADASLWSGRCQLRLGEPKRARELYQNALEVSPGYEWVKHVLLPEADRAIASADSTSHP